MTGIEYSKFESVSARVVVSLFNQVFTQSEGETEGRIVADLVSDMITLTPSNDLIGFVATSDSFVVGCIFFSRFILPSDESSFLLSPVAVSTEQQGKHVGQGLINYGLKHLKSLDVALVFTYGDPSFYAKVGFDQITESVVKPPFELSQPEGWLAQSLNGAPIQAMQGRAKCVEALSDASYW
jgi:putative acetyltransferase